MDMNILANPKALDIIKKLGTMRVNSKVVYYELICGIDYRFLTKEIAEALKSNRFINIRFAWDWTIKDQYKIKDVIDLLTKAGYKRNSLMCFIICDWKITFIECMMKLMLLKNWNIKVSPCYYDNEIPPNFQLNYWTYKQCRTFQDLCSLHNQTVSFGIYPDLKRLERVSKRIFF